MHVALGVVLLCVTGTGAFGRCHYSFLRAPIRGRAAHGAVLALPLGDDEQSPRNPIDALASLKQAFYAPAAQEEAFTIQEKAPYAGIYRDMPLCRWPWEILPHHQMGIVVHEPQYLLMFEQLLATPPPHEYVHLLLQDGTENLGNPEYALRPGTKAPLTGTHMRIVAHLREDVRTTSGATAQGLIMVVQGMARVQVLKEVQALPYSRADVLLAPDVEALRTSAHLSRDWLRQSDRLRLTKPSSRIHLALACAFADEQHWQRLEASTASVEASPTPKLCGLSALHVEGSMDTAAKCAHDAMRKVALSDMDEGDEGEGEGGAQAGEAEAQLLVAVHEPTLASLLGAHNVDEGNVDDGNRTHDSSALHTEWLRSLLDAIEDTAVEGEAQLHRQLSSGVVSSVGIEQLTRQASAVDAVEAAEDAQTLRDLEVQIWLELDNLIDPDGKRGESALAGVFVTDGDVPHELLALLPPPPEAGWPLGFGMQALAERVRARASLEALMTTSPPIDRLSTALGSEYPLLRRTGRLSFAVWAVIGAEDGAPLQRVLEATSTAERLRFAVLRMRRMTGRSFHPSGGPDS